MLPISPKYAGKDVINPTALILSSVMMLRHLGEAEAAERVEDAVLVTLEEGRAVTQDLARQSGGDVEQAASTSGFTDAVIANLGRRPTKVARRPAASATGVATLPRWSYAPEWYARIDRRTIGLDIFIESDAPVEELGRALEPLAGPPFRLEMISSRGTKVYPSTGVASDNVRVYRCRFTTPDGSGAAEADLLALHSRVASAHHGWTHVEKLHVFDGEPGFTRAQGQ